MDKLLDNAIAKAKSAKNKHKYTLNGAMLATGGALVYGMLHALPATLLTTASVIVSKVVMDLTSPGRKVMDKWSRFQIDETEYNVRLKSLNYHKNNWRPLERRDYRSDEGFAIAKAEQAQNAQHDRALFNTLKHNGFEALFAYPEKPEQLPTYVRPKKKFRSPMSY